MGDYYHGHKHADGAYLPACANCVMVDARKAFDEEKAKLHDDLDALRRECAQMSEELGLPPTIRPAEGELRRMQQSLERVGAALRHCRAVRDGILDPIEALRRIENVLTCASNPDTMPLAVAEALREQLQMRDDFLANLTAGVKTGALSHTDAVNDIIAFVDGIRDDEDEDEPADDSEGQR